MQTKVAIAAILICAQMFMIESRSEGGSWNDGYTLKDVVVNYNNKETVEDYLTIIYPTALVNPTSESEKLGLILDVNSAGSVLLKFLVFGNDGKYYIPFRYMDCNWSYYNPVGSNKLIHGWVTNDNGSSFYVTLKLPYELFGSYIDDTQGNDIVNYINKYCKAAKTAVIKAKGNVSASASVYLTNKPILDGLKGDEASYQNQLASLQDRQTTLSQNIETAKASAASLQKEIIALQNTLKAKENNLDEINSNLSNWAQESSDIQITLAKAQNKSSSTQSNEQQYEVIVVQASQNFTSSVYALESLAPTRVPDLENVSNEVLNLDSNAQNDLNDILNKVYPNKQN